MVGMSLPVDGSCDRELKVRGLQTLRLDWTQDSEVAPSQTSGGNSTVIFSGSNMDAAM